MAIIPSVSKFFDAASVSKVSVFSQRDPAEIWYPLATETAIESYLYVLVSNSVTCFLFSNTKKIGRRTNSWPFKNERMIEGHSSSIEFQDVVL